VVFGGQPREPPSQFDTPPLAAYTLRENNSAGSGRLEGRENRPRSRHCDRPALRSILPLVPPERTGKAALERMGQQRPKFPPVFCGELGKAESQDMLPGWSKLTLFAREGVAIRLVLSARLFYLQAGQGRASCSGDFADVILGLERSRCSWRFRRVHRLVLRHCSR
jgi:hypothetical protein